MPNTETMAQAEARLWLASLEKDCPGVYNTQISKRLAPCMTLNPGWWKTEGPPWTHDVDPCHGTGKVPVLDLREPCPQINRLDKYGYPHLTGLDISCCQGRGWLPKQGRDALFMAMDKDGWDCATESLGYGGAREIRFSRFVAGCGRIHGEDSDPWLAAVKAMKAAVSLV